jgi:hypothetical protein
MIGTGFIFGCQVLKIRQKQKRKKRPTTQNKKVEKCRDVIPKVWWKLGGLALAWFQSEKVVAQISDLLWLKPKQGFPFSF